jgi:hypothetical protein
VSATATVTAPPGAPRSIRIRHREFPVVLPSMRDPRLHVAAVVVSVQVLGQVSLGFELSIAQILVAVLTCAVLEVAITFWRRGALVWPASALLTGNGVALILRVPGTEHGDWWSLRGAWIFAAVAAFSLLSKYAIRVGGRPLFNPSNLGLVVGFVVLGTNRVNPQDLWWGPMSVGLALTYAIIIGGGLVMVWRLRMVTLAAAFWVTYAAGIGIVVLSGHAMSARWHVGPVSGWLFWWVLVTSPEILVFLFFMITDPRTAPRGQVARVVYGAAVGFVAALLVAPAQTEFWTKVAILGALTVVCTFRPLLERLLPSPGSADDRVGSWLAHQRPGRADARAARWERLGGVVVLATGLIVIAGIPARNPTTPPLPRVDPTRVAARPDVRLPPGAVPRVAISPAVTPIVPSFDQARADNMAHDLVADLVIAGDALIRRDPRLVASAGTGTWLLDLQQRIARAGNDGTVDVPRYRFDEIAAVLVRRTGQSSPQIMLSVQGTVRNAASAKPGARPVGGAPQPFHRAYLMAPAGRYWFIASEQPPP